jgi:hypothetical protein
MGFIRMVRLLLIHTSFEVEVFDDFLYDFTQGKVRLFRIIGMSNGDIYYYLVVVGCQISQHVSMVVRDILKAI